METVVQNTKENSGAIFTNSVGVVTLCPVDKNLGLTGHGKPVPKSESLARKCAQGQVAESLFIQQEQLEHPLLIKVSNHSDGSCVLFRLNSIKHF